MSNTASENRGFVLNSQRVVLDLDFAGAAKATTHLTIKPTNARLSTVFLHAASCLQITGVTLSGPDPEDPVPPLPAFFTHHDPLLGLPESDDPSNKFDPSQPDAIQRHPEIKRRLWSAMAEKGEGELAIDVSHGWVRLAKSVAGETGQAGLAEIMISIEYVVVMSELDREGIVWRRPGDAGNDLRVPHIFINSSSHDSARHWIPCLDNLWDRCGWELEISVPRYLEQETEEEDEELGAVEGEISESKGDLVRVVASAELEEQVIHPEDTNRTIFYFVQSNPTSAQQISFAAGPFHLHVLPEDERARLLLDSSNPSADTQPLILAYCLPGYEIDLANTVSIMRRAMSYFETFDAYPYSSFSMVFVEDPVAQSMASASMGTFSLELLYPPEVLEQAFITRPILTRALAAQWSGIHMAPKTFSDTWLTTGLALYMNALFTKHLLGNNEYRYRLRVDMERCLGMDQGDQYPLCVPGAIAPPDSKTMDFISLKAPLVLHILDRRMARLTISAGLARNAIPQILREARGGILAERALSTEDFFRSCRKVSKTLDILTFQEEWVTGSGCPSFLVGVQYNRKNQSLAVSVFQGASRAWQLVAAREPSNLDWKKPTKHFTGEITLRVHDGEGAPLEHIIEIGEDGLNHELMYTQHIKRPHRLRTGQFRREKGLPPIIADEEDERLRREQAIVDEEWKFANWSEAEAAAFIEQGFDWIRYDPECEWIASMEVLAEVQGIGRSTFPKVNMTYHWLSQLQNDPDVIAQREAILRLASEGSSSSSALAVSTLTKIVQDDSIFYRIRIFAIEALLNMTAEVDGVRLSGFHLRKYLQSTFCVADEVDGSVSLMQPAFGNLRRYLVFQALLRELSHWRWNPAVPEETDFERWLLQTFVDIIDAGDSGSPDFSQSIYIASVITNLTAMLKRFTLPTRAGDNFRKSLESIDRALALDKLLPSHNNVITIAGLQAKLAIAFTDKDPLPASIPFYFAYSRPGNLLAVRKLAIDCALACQLPSPSLLRHIRILLRREPSLSLRRHVVESLIASWLSALAFGELDDLHLPPPRATESLESRLDREEREMEKDVPALRRSLALNAELARFVTSALVDAQNDDDLRSLMLQAAEIITPGRREGAAAKLVLKLGTKPINTATSVQEPQKKKPKGRQYRSGLSEEDYMAINITLHKLIAHPASEFFREPVPDDDAVAPQYYKIIKQPMDLSSIKHKLIDGQYMSRQEFRNDIELVGRNCTTYNPAGSVHHQAGLNFGALFQKQWTKVETTLQKRAGPGAEATKPGPPTIKFTLGSKPAPSAPTLAVKPPTALPAQSHGPSNGTQRKDFAQPGEVRRQKPGPKPGQRKKQKDNDVEADLLALLPGDALPAKPGPKKHNPGTATSTLAKPAVIPNVPAPVAGPISTLAPSATALPSGVDPGPNVKQLTLRGFTSSRKPFRPLRIQKLLAELKTFEWVFGPKPLAIHPNYYTEIKNPMWFGLIVEKMAKKQYQTEGQAAADFEQIIWNCRRYNGVNADIETLGAAPFEAKLLLEWPKIVLLPGFTAEERKIMDKCIDDLMKKSADGHYFVDPVDPVILGIPDYFNVIRPEDARDLSTIRKQMKNNPKEYGLEQLDADMLLMLDNARKYNGAQSLVGQAASRVEVFYEQKRKMVEPWGTARGLGNANGKASVSKQPPRLM